VTENERLKIFRHSLKQTQFKFGEVANIKQGSYADIERGKVKVSTDLKLALSKEFSLNIEWLETGKGEMFLPESRSNGKFISEINYPLEPGETPFIELGEGQYLMVMPLVHEYAYAGYLSGYADPEYVEELSKHTIVVTKQHRGTYRAFEIVGDSMDDGTKESIPDGSIATGREIQRHLWKSPFHTHRFKDYIIVHQTEGILNKRIVKHDVEKGFITCHSLNPDKEIYPDFKLHLDEVKQIFNIVNVSIPR
jgi:transcriptional regulator with XRE-family HTH domain